MRPKASDRKRAREKEETKPVATLNNKEGGGNEKIINIDDDEEDDDDNIDFGADDADDMPAPADKKPKLGVVIVKDEGGDKPAKAKVKKAEKEHLFTPGQEQDFLQFAEQFKNGVSQMQLTEGLPQISLLIQAEIINSLLKKNRLSLHLEGDQYLYKVVDSDTAIKFRGLSPQDLNIYQHIERSGNLGLWIRHLRQRCNLHKTVVDKTLKELMKRKLIKEEKSIAAKNKKVFMLFELVPAKEVTGGAWYSGHDFDQVFIDELYKVCFACIKKHGSSTADQVCAFIAQSSIFNVDCSLDDIIKVLKTLYYDALIEVVRKPAKHRAMKVTSDSVQRAENAMVAKKRKRSGVVEFENGSTADVDVTQNQGQASLVSPDDESMYIPAVEPIAKKIRFNLMTSEEVSETDRMRAGGMTFGENTDDEDDLEMDIAAMKSDPTDEAAIEKAKRKQIAEAQVEYRVVKQGVLGSPLTNIPCSHCPVVNQCEEGLVVNPQACKYLDDWLSGHVGGADDFDSSA